MRYQKVEKSLSEATAFLDQIVTRREKLIKESRDVISLSSKTIVNIHTSNLKEAQKLNIEARNQLKNLRKIAGTDLVRYLMTPEQEFVESSVMLSLRAQKDIPSRASLGVLPASYVLGLLDSIGELKRSVYDSIRQGNLKTAEELFSTMESLYVLISSFAVYDNVVQGLRRKLDVARILIEDTRATITEEVRRLEFMDSVNKLAAQLGKPRGSFPERSRMKRSSSEVEPIEEGESIEGKSTETSISGNEPMP